MPPLEALQTIHSPVGRLPVRPVHAASGSRAIVGTCGG